MAQPRIFVSYARTDGQEWLDRVVRHLSGIGEVEVWTDERIAAGDEWDVAIRDAMGGAVVAVMLLTPGFLASAYIRRTETPVLLDRMRRDGLHVVGVWAASCSWKKQAPWLTKLQVKPQKPLAGLRGDNVDAALSEIADDISNVVERTGAPERPGGGAGPEWVDIARLPATDEVFLGRGEELVQLDNAWHERGTGVVSVVAWGGEGKSALVNEWVGRMREAGWRGAARVYGVSFFSQGTRDHTVSSADEAVLAMLRRFGDPNPTHGTADDRGARLAHLVRQKRTLLVLDGLEPLQRGPGPDEGKLTDPALRALLRNLAMDNPGLCVVTTRVHVTDIAQWKDRGASELRLPNLGAVDGAELLRQKGVRGTATERQAVALAFGGHALALHLLGTWLEEAYGGDIARVADVPLLNDDTAPGRHARRVMESYATWLGDGPERRLWWMLGLFDRPVKRPLVDAIREPAIVGLTDGFGQDVPFNRAVSRLRKLGLVWEEAGALDAHPLVRAYAAERLKGDLPEVWRDAHSRLFDWLCGTTVEFPEAVEEMVPLFQAIPHGCAAGRHADALDVYRDRTMRGGQFYADRPLETRSMDVTCLAAFFDGCWTRPHLNLLGERLGFLLNQVGSALLSAGSVRDARMVFERCSLLADITSNSNRLRSVSAANVAAAFCLSGEIGAAIRYVRVLGEGAPETRFISELVLTCAGFDDEARVVRAELPGVAEAAPPWHESRDAVRFRRNALQRLAHDPTLIPGQRAHLRLTAAVSIASDLSRGSRAPAGGIGFAAAAIEALRRVGDLPMLDVALLTRAALHRFAGDLRAARVDLDEAFDLADRCGMRLHLADAHLEYARLAIAEKAPSVARDHLTQAKALIHVCGYKRRDRDAAQIERQLERLGP